MTEHEHEWGPVVWPAGESRCRTCGEWSDYERGYYLQDMKRYGRAVRAMLEKRRKVRVP